MRALAWAVLAVLAFVAAAALIFLAFTRFDGGDAARSPDERASYERRMFADAQMSVALGIAGGFAFLGGAACAQRAWRTRTAS